MSEGILLLDIFYYFLATTVCVPFFKFLKLGSVLGYLVAGLFLGPSGLSLLHHVDNINEISQIGIIILLFVIGLELSPARLKHMQKSIWVSGTLQFVGTSAIFWAIISFFEISSVSALIVACALTLSSTAFSLTYLKDTHQITKSYGQTSFGVLIFQDLIIIPLLTVVPLLASEGTSSAHLNFSLIFKNIFIVVGSIFVGRFLLPPVMSFIHRSQSKEIFIGSSLMLVIGASLLMDQAGLSKALGAFIAGIILSDSKLRVEIQGFSVTLKSMLMGVFFMGIGLSFDLSFFYKNLNDVLLVTTTFMGIKSLVLFVIGYFTHKSWSSGIKMAGILSQGGEFGLLLLGVATSSLIFSDYIESLVISSMALSIFLAPFVVKFTEMVTFKSDNMPVLESNVVHLSRQADASSRINDNRAA
jgi:CPA2 family monovalent cation:H+ antiporter-2